MYVAHNFHTLLHNAVQYTALPHMSLPPCTLHHQFFTTSLPLLQRHVPCELHIVQSIAVRVKWCTMYNAHGTNYHVPCELHIVQSRAVRVKAKQEKAADGCDFSASWQSLHPLSLFLSFYPLFHILIQLSCNHNSLPHGKAFHPLFPFLSFYLPFHIFISLLIF